MNPPENQQQVDHAEEARGTLQWLLGDGGGPNTLDPDVDPRCGPALQLAQVHASLAIAEQLERLNDQLAEVMDPAAGTFPGVIRVRTEGTEG